VQGESAVVELFWTKASNIIFLREIVSTLREANLHKADLKMCVGTFFSVLSVKKKARLPGWCETQDYDSIQSECVELRLRVLSRTKKVKLASSVE
jgi:hypothetical protein